MNRTAIHDRRALWSLSAAMPRAMAPALATVLARWSERLLRAQLRQLEHGEITLVDGERRDVFGRLSERCALRATLHVRDARFYAEIALGGSVGAGESYMAGDWWCDDLTALVRILLHNRNVIEGVDGGWARVSGPLRSNNGELLARAAVEGLGLIRASELEVACEQRAGKLVQVLGEYEVASNAALWALYPSAKHVLPRMRALLDFLADWFRHAGNGGRAAAVGTLAVVADGATNGAARAKVQLRAG